MSNANYIFKSFVAHEMLREKYGLKEAEIPDNVYAARRSDIPIIKTIGLIVEELEAPHPTTDANLRNKVLQSLNEAV